jgi:hypothetical protein
MIKQNTQSMIKQNTQPMIKQNTQPMIKGNIQPMIKQNTEPMIKQNTQPMIKQNTQPMIKGNIQPMIKQNTEPMIKQNTQFMIKQNTQSMIKGNTQPMIKGNTQSMIKGNIQPMIKGNTQPMIKGNTEPMIKGNTEPMIKGNTQPMIKGNSVVGVKGDMDGLGKEKGTYSPRFVYLYKNKFEMEALSNKYDMKGLSPLSGYEPKYNPNYWNNNKNIKNNNNCYSYSVNNKNHQFGKPQPGYFARYNHILNNQYKCAYFFKRILNDIPSVYLTSFKQKCKNGFHKAFFAIDSNKNEHDYHFYRQDNNQLWSHKPGTTNVINYDADYKIIKNPYNANRNYTTYNYDKPCFFFCVNNKFGKTKAKI